MATIEVYKLKIKNTKEIESKKSTFYWYNTFYKKMEKLEGSELKIGYREEEYVELENGTRLPLSEARKEDKERFGIKKEWIQFPEAINRTQNINMISYDKEVIIKLVDEFSEKREGVELYAEKPESIIFEIPDKYIKEFEQLMDSNNIIYR